jgi:hypothetical protein
MKQMKGKKRGLQEPMRTCNFVVILLDLADYGLEKQSSYLNGRRADDVPEKGSKAIFAHSLPAVLGPRYRHKSKASWIAGKILL